MPKPQRGHGLAVVKPATKLPVQVPDTYYDIVRALPTELVQVAHESDAKLRRQRNRLAMARCAFAYWIAKYKHPRARLDDIRLKVLLARLAECDDDLNEVLWALDGAHLDDVVMGRRPGFSKNDGIELILRDRAHLERYAERTAGYRDGRDHPIYLKYFGPLVGGDA